MIDSEKLIEAVRDRRALYDHRMVEYSNKPLVNALWMDVAKELDTSGNEPITNFVLTIILVVQL